VQAKRLTATGTVHGAAGALHGFYVSSTTTGTLVIRDGGAAGAQKSGTITPAVGYHEFPATFGVDLHVTIANSLDVTFFYEG
jgi:hypothetical protein